ncbi:MAG: hypothetical protein JWO79_4126, partial [Actinomycetia bacterium]|nr:hypothetical protein [Actinomycetes bacterium]
LSAGPAAAEHERSAAQHRSEAARHRRAAEGEPGPSD